MISGTLFVVTLFVSSGFQKKENSEICFRRGDVVILDGDVTLFMSSASGFQKKNRSETGFVRGVTGDEMNFVGGAIQRDTTCCMGAS